MSDRLDGGGGSAEKGVVAQGLYVRREVLAGLEKVVNVWHILLSLSLLGQIATTSP